MSLLSLFFTIIITLTTVLAILGQILPARTPDLEKISPYECGFDPINSARLPFSFRFFLIAILFIIFDLEIILLLPIPLSILNQNTHEFMIPFIAFTAILTVGLIYEWLKGGLEWAQN